jgi:BirA family biotin operon repressor/biotin-[acetyl-CoA-carboxylase] ligase
MPELFDTDRFHHDLRTTWLGREFIYIEETHSTNSYLKAKPSRELIHGTVALTDHQTRGRGQYERSWESEQGKNLTFTIAFRPKEASRLNLLSLASAYATARALELHLDKGVSLKWPNDLMVAGKKVGGLLTESVFSGERPERILIGIGLNVNQEQFPKKLCPKATSMQILAGKACPREKMLCDILVEMEQVYHAWEREVPGLQQEVCKKMIGYGDWVYLSINGEVLDKMFKFIGIGKRGELLMLNEQLDVNTFRYEQVRIITSHQRVSPADEHTSTR